MARALVACVLVLLPGLVFAQGDEKRRDAIADLASSDAKKRAQGAESLGEIGKPEDFALLEKACADPDAGVRSEALASAVKLGGERALPVVEKALEDPETAVKRVAADAVCRLKLAPDVAARLFGRLAHDPERGVRIAALDQLRAIGGRELYRVAGELLADPDPMVVRKAETILLNISEKDMPAFPFAAVEKALDEAPTENDLFHLVQIAEVPLDFKVPFPAGALARCAVRAKPDGARHRAVAALAASVELAPVATASIASVASSLSFLAASDAAEDRLSAMTTFVRAKLPGGVPLVAARLDDTDASVRKAAGNALWSAIGDLEVLTEMLRRADGSAGARGLLDTCAVEKRSALVPALLRLLEGDDAWLRERAWRRLIILARPVSLGAFDPEGPLEDRREAIRRVEAWWASAGSGK
jgi:HEAT repeat protein